MKHLFIVNPIAGGRQSKFEETKRAIDVFAETSKDPVEVYVTTGSMDATRKIIEEADKLASENQNSNGEAINLYVYACGGDGTLNECVNGAAGRSNVAVTQYPCGTGNDFLRTFAPDDLGVFCDFNVLSTGSVKQIDIIECIIGDGEQGSIKHTISSNSTGDTKSSGGYKGKAGKSRYGINICSVGVDARIGTDVHKYSHIPIIGGSMGYIVSLIVNVIKGITQQLCIKTKSEVDESGTPRANRIFDKKYTLACVCNGRFYGGGFNPVPDALTDDGILECLILEPISRLKVANIVGKYSKGQFAKFPKLFHHIRCKEIEIAAAKISVINIDGEAVYAKKITFRVIPKGINYIFPAGI